MEIFLSLFYYYFIYHFNSVRVGAVILQNHFSASYMKIFCKKTWKNILNFPSHDTILFLKCYGILDHLSWVTTLIYDIEKR